MLSTGEIKVYKRVKGYVELHEVDALESWKVVKEKDLNELQKLLLHFDDLLEKKIEIRITKERYPTLYKILKEFEERNEDAWVHVYGIPKIHIDFLYLLLFSNVNRDVLFARSDMPNLSEEEEEKLNDDIWQLLEDIDDAIYKAYSGLGISEIVSIDEGDYAEIVIDAIFGFEEALFFLLAVVFVPLYFIFAVLYTIFHHVNKRIKRNPIQPHQIFKKKEALIILIQKKIHEFDFSYFKAKKF